MEKRTYTKRSNEDKIQDGFNAVALIAKRESIAQRKRDEAQALRIKCESNPTQALELKAQLKALEAETAERLCQKAKEKAANAFPFPVVELTESHVVLDVLGEQRTFYKNEVPEAPEVEEVPKKKSKKKES